MSDAPPDTSQSFTRIPITIDGDAIARVASLAIDLREDGHVLELPARLFGQLPFAIYICDPDGLVLRYNRPSLSKWDFRVNYGTIGILTGSPA
jgi:hypothetical protein